MSEVFVGDVSIQQYFILCKKCANYLSVVNVLLDIRLLNVISVNLLSCGSRVRTAPESQGARVQRKKECSTKCRKSERMICKLICNIILLLFSVVALQHTFFFSSAEPTQWWQAQRSNHKFFPKRSLRSLGTLRTLRTLRKSDFHVPNPEFERVERVSVFQVCLLVVDVGGALF